VVSLKGKDWYKKIDIELDAIRDRTGVDRKTLDGVFDKSTLHVFGKLFSDRVLETLDFPISRGKEAIVFRGSTRDKRFVAVKVYFTSNATFKHILKYIQGDPRFKTFKNRRNLIYEWAKKEFNNLDVLRKMKINAPMPISRLKNVLVMEYIGTEKYPAPLMKDVKLINPSAILDILLESVKILFKHAGLVHGDLSEYNVLIYEGNPYIIDVGQMILKEHPMAYEFLKRDLLNLSKFFKRFNVVFDENAYFEELTGKKNGVSQI
jgi:RIO kinase 1